MVLIMSAWLCVNPVMLAQSGKLAVALSWLPWSSPIIMPIRMGLTSVSPVEIVWVDGIVAAIGSIFTIWLSARIYRVGMLMYGKKPSFREVAKWIRYASIFRRARHSSTLTGASRRGAVWKRGRLTASQKSRRSALSAARSHTTGFRRSSIRCCKWRFHSPRSSGFGDGSGRRLDGRRPACSDCGRFASSASTTSENARRAARGREWDDASAAPSPGLAGGLVLEGFVQLMRIVFKCPGCAG